MDEEILKAIEANTASIALQTEAIDSIDKQMGKMLEMLQEINKKLNNIDSSVNVIQDSIIS